MDKEFLEHGLNHNRRKFLSRLSLGVGSVALGSLLIPDLFSGKKEAEESLMRALPHFAPKAKRIIYLFQMVRLLNWKPLITNPSSSKISDKSFQNPYGWGSA